jgi:hypothetical protein
VGEQEAKRPCLIEEVKYLERLEHILERLFMEVDYLERALSKVERRLSKLEECCGQQIKLSREGYLHFLVVPQESGKGIEYLKRRLADKQYVVIVDPYLLNLREDHQVELFLELLRNKSRIDIYTRKKSIRESALKRLKEESGADIYIAYVGEEVHDRVWFWFEEENSEPQGVVVGTSFNGLGKHFTFVLDLPKEDAREFWKHLSYAYQQRLTQIRR